MTDELPKGWAAIPLRELVDSAQPGFASGQKNVKNGVPHLRMNNIGVTGTIVFDLVRTVPHELALAKYDLMPGDVLVCTTNSSDLVGKCGLFNLSGRYVFSNHLTRLRPKPGLIDSDFLRWNLWLHWQRGTFDDKCKHWVNQSALPRDALLDTEICVPPRDEQHRIVTKLEQLFRKVEGCKERLDKVPTILKRFRQSVLASACSGTEVPLNTLATCIYGTSTKSEPAGQIPVLRMGNVQNGEIDWSNLVYTSDAEEIARYRLPPNTVLFNRTNSPELVGKTALYRGDRPAIFAGYLIRVNIHGDLDPEYLNFCLNAPAAKEWCSQVKTDGVSQSNINATKLGDFPVPLRSLAEQRHVVATVNAFFRLANEIEMRYLTGRRHVDKLTQSILAKAFGGELVPTEAEVAEAEGREFEDARQLLDRISRCNARSTQNGRPKSRPLAAHM